MRSLLPTDKDYFLLNAAYILLGKLGRRYHDGPGGQLVHDLLVKDLLARPGDRHVKLPLNAVRFDRGAGVQ
jgi:hypothetical protein